MRSIVGTIGSNIRRLETRRRGAPQPKTKTGAFSFLWTAFRLEDLLSPPGSALHGLVLAIAVESDDDDDHA
jgi:hypothetical protein